MYRKMKNFQSFTVSLLLFFLFALLDFSSFSRTYPFSTNTYHNGLWHVRMAWETDCTHDLLCAYFSD